MREQTVVVDTSFHEEKTTYSNWWFAVPFLASVILILYSFAIYEQIPNQLPMHTSFSGTVTYDEKSIANVLFLPLTQMFLIGIFLFINVIIKRSKQQLSAERPSASKKQNVLFRKWWSLYSILGSFIMTALLTFSQFTLFHEALKKYEDAVLFSGLGLLLIGAIVVSILIGQGGSRIELDEKADETKIDRDHDRYWKLGQFYFNKNDPAIFIEKRFGIGWTNNWAHPVSWILLFVVVASAIGIPLFIALFA